MSPDIPLHDREHVIRSGEHIAIKSGWYRLILTNMRIILISEQSGTPADIDLHDLEAAEAGRGPAGDPSITLSVQSGLRGSKHIVLVFTRRGKKGRERERDEWIAAIRDRRPVTAPPSPPPVSTDGPVFCSGCGRKMVAGSAFCDRCGMRITLPAPPQEPVRVPARKAPGSTQTSTRKFGDLPYGAPEPRVKKAQQVPGRPFTGRPPSPARGKMKIAAGAGLAVIALVILLYFSGIAGTPGLFAFMNMSGNASAANTSATPLPAPPVTAAAAASPESAAAPESAPADSSDPPLTVFDQYISFYQAGDAAGLYGLLSESAKSSTTQDAISATLSSQLAEGTAFGGYNIVSQNEQADTATLVLEDTWVIGGEAAVVTDTIPFVRENGRWKLNTLVIASKPA